MQLHELYPHLYGSTTKDWEQLEATILSLPDNGGIPPQIIRNMQILNAEASNDYIISVKIPTTLRKCKGCRKKSNWAGEFKTCEICRQKKRGQRKKNINLNLCASCAGPKEMKTNRYCAKCQELERERKQTQKNVSRLAGKCCKCFNKPAIVLDGHCSECRFVSAKSQARRRGKIWELSFPLYASKIKEDCYYCELPNTVKQGVGLDRIDNNLGYIEGNVHSACEVCNKLRANNCSSEDFKKYYGPQVRQYRLTRDTGLKKWWTGTILSQLEGLDA